MLVRLQLFGSQGSACCRPIANVVGAFLTRPQSSVKCVCMDGKKLKQIRESLGESQAKFALRFDVSRQVIHHWEHRDTPTRGIGARTINRIIRGLPVSAALLKESSK